MSLLHSSKTHLSSTDYESCVDLQQSVLVHPSAIDPEQQRFDHGHDM